MLAIKREEVRNLSVLINILSSVPALFQFSQISGDFAGSEYTYIWPEIHFVLGP